MQNLKYKILWALPLLLGSSFLRAQTPDDRSTLLLADSLFTEEKYTESLELYDQLLYQDQLYTPAMLLKMAYVKEGLGDYSEALYCLNLYYSKTSDNRALRKMEELAKHYNLQGYQFTDVDFFRTVVKRYYLQLMGVLSALALFLFSLILYRKRRSNTRPVFTALGFVLVLGLLFALINFGQGNDKAIILAEQAYLREGPSSGANVTDIIAKGHRVEVVGKKDVWVRIKWNDRPRYIRESQLAIIES